MEFPSASLKSENDSNGPIAPSLSPKGGIEQIARQAMLASVAGEALVAGVPAQHPAGRGEPERIRLHAAGDVLHLSLVRPVGPLVHARLGPLVLGAEAHLEDGQKVEVQDR